MNRLPFVPSLSKDIQRLEARFNASGLDRREWRR